MNTILSVRDLGKGFYIHDRAKHVPAAEGISFDLKPGQLAALVGPSGAGKSSLLKAIYRTYLPSSGQVLYRTAAGDLVDLASAPETRITDLRRAEIGFVTQFLHCLPRLSTLDVVARPLLQQGVARAAAHDKAARILTALAIPQQLWDATPATFSGGERQRVNIARSFTQGGRLMLLDEPTASLDPVAGENVCAMIEAAKAEGTAMVGIFHDMAVVDRLADVKINVERKAFEAVA
ncbi:alpha-D-ribose 1-methylphosphonate 5-triphosphate synthase subunit PhnL [Rhodobacteraceae bacterium MBR-64]|jgi:alpha-D-ribose 1-methylphosphonate 5-triphosphate synthase subunit PhnL